MAGRIVTKNYSCFIAYVMTAHTQMPHICYNRLPKMNDLTAVLLPHQVYIPNSTKGLYVDGFPGTFIYCKEIQEAKLVSALVTLEHLR